MFCSAFLNLMRWSASSLWWLPAMQCQQKATSLFGPAMRLGLAGSVGTSSKVASTKSVLCFVAVSCCCSFLLFCLCVFVLFIYIYIYTYIYIHSVCIYLYIYINNIYPCIYPRTGYVDDYYYYYVTTTTHYIHSTSHHAAAPPPPLFCGRLVVDVHLVHRAAPLELRPPQQPTAVMHVAVAAHAVPLREALLLLRG